MPDKEQLPKAYDPKGTEDRIYAMWEDSGAFVANPDSGREPFTISLPPPNATGSLHLGHAVMLAIQDTFIRFARMKGKEALWVPGTDHAAIATENVVIKKLKKEGMRDPRAQLGREELVKKIAEFVEGSQGTIRGQMRKMGASCDWSRERYTMDPVLNRCVNEVFAKMYGDGLIYRGHRIVNWDPNLQTTVSDDEVDRKEEKGVFYTFKYGPFEIGTARPETKFGDKYVVMHPDDERYAQYQHGDTFECEWINGPIRATVIKDTAVDPAFGTGVMTITPWHDAVDFEMAERHGLEKEQVIDFQGKLLPIAGEFAGMKIEDARPLIVEKLSSKGLLVKVDENYVHSKASNSRGGGVIEPQIKLQWFIDVKRPAFAWKGKMMSLKEVMHDVVHAGDIAIVPDRFEKTYFSWIDNLRDWCISRQIWWGHRVPVWYRGEEVYCGAKAPDGEGWTQDEDTLDTWFSSALWTWSTLIDPSLADDHSLDLQKLLEKSPDFQRFHPTSLMETGYDILFFWVARMILMTTYATGQIPFKTVYLHGMVRTRDGRKMSKSDPDTMIDPLEIIPEYGADALRLSMMIGQSPGADSKLYKEKIAGYRNFINKLWNASRFVLMQCEQKGIDPRSLQFTGQESDLSLADRALLSSLQGLIDETTKDLEAYRLSAAGDRLYGFVWDYFCDWYLELSKGEANPTVLVHGLRTLVQLLHPFCPFVTEELWDKIAPADGSMLVRETWPVASETFLDKGAEAQLQLLIDVITAIRKLRNDAGIEPSKEVEVLFITNDRHGTLLREQALHVCRMAKVRQLDFIAKMPEGRQVSSEFLSEVEVHLSLEGLIDVEKETKAAAEEHAKLSKYALSLEAKLGNDSFTSRAPEAVVAVEREKLAEAKAKMAKLEERLAQLKAMETPGA